MAAAGPKRLEFEIVVKLSSIFSFKTLSRNRGMIDSSGFVRIGEKTFPQEHGVKR